MTEKEHLEIPLSRRKLIMTLLGAIIFVGLGLWFLINPPQNGVPILGNTTLIFTTGLVSVLFFGLIAGIIFRKLSDTKAGLIINEQGIVDNSSGVSAGLVLWSDIKEIKVSQVMNQKFLMFIVNNPQVYIERVPNKLKRKGVEMNYKIYGSPISISANSLEIRFDNLHELLINKMKEYTLI